MKKFIFLAILGCILIGIGCGMLLIQIKYEGISSITKPIQELVYDILKIRIHIPEIDISIRP